MALYPNLHEGVVQVGDASVRYYDSVAGDARPPIVLVHGTGGSAESSFWALFPMLAFTRRVIALDLVTPSPDRPLELDDYVAQVRAVIARTCQTDAACLVGYSLGAVVAAAVAAEAPSEIASLVLISGWITTDRHQLLRNDVWAQLHSDDSPALSAFQLLAAYSPRYIVGRSPADWTAMRESAASVRYSPQVMDLNRRIDISRLVGQIIAPTLVIACTQDLMVPLHHSQHLFGAIADARFVEVASGHAVVSERPAEVFSHIDAFASQPTAHAPGTVLRPDHA